MIGVSHRQSSLSPPPSVSCGCSAMPAKWTSAVLRRVPLPRAHSDNSPAGQRDPLSQMSTGAGQDQRRLTRAEVLLNSGASVAVSADPVVSRTPPDARKGSVRPMRRHSHGIVDPLDFSSVLERQEQGGVTLTFTVSTDVTG